MIWPCNANRNEHAGENKNIQASTPGHFQHKRRDDDEYERQKRGKKIKAHFVANRYRYSVNSYGLGQPSNRQSARQSIAYLRLGLGIEFG